jgi:hypothetical protein
LTPTAFGSAVVLPKMVHLLPYFNRALGAVGYFGAFVGVPVTLKTRGGSMRIDASGEDFIVNVDREELTGEVDCRKSRDNRERWNRKPSYRTGVRCYTLTFPLKQLREVEADDESEYAGTRQLVI